MSKRDFYEVLGIERTATDGEIKSAYRKLALKYHPDRNPGNHEAEERFKEAAEAYAVLADTQKRSLYDRFGHAGVGGVAGAGSGFDPSVFVGFEDILGGLGDIFGFGDLFGGGRRRGGPQRGADLRYDLEISFDEAARGTETTIQIPRAEQCDTCGGTGAAKGTGPTTCPMCHGRGQLRYQQGFFTVARTCGQCRGTGQVIASTLRDVPRRRTRHPGAQAHGEDPGRHRDRPANAPLRRRRARRRWRAVRRSLRGRGRAAPLVLRAGRQRSPLRRAGQLHDPRTRRRGLGAGTPRRRGIGVGARRLADRNDLPLAGQGHARRVWPWPRRSARHGPGHRAEEADEGAACRDGAACRRSSRPRSSSRRSTTTRRRGCSRR